MTTNKETLQKISSELKDLIDKLDDLAHETEERYLYASVRSEYTDDHGDLHSIYQVDSPGLPGTIYLEGLDSVETLAEWLGAKIW